MDERADTLIRPYMEPKEGFNYNAAAPSTKDPKYLAYAEDEMLIGRTRVLSVQQTSDQFQQRKRNCSSVVPPRIELGSNL